MTKSSPLLLALDFGGTKHTAAVISPGQRQWHAHQRAFYPPNTDATTDLKIMTTLVREVLAGEKPSAIGVSFGGPVDKCIGMHSLRWPSRTAFYQMASLGVRYSNRQGG